LAQVILAQAIQLILLGGSLLPSKLMKTILMQSFAAALALVSTDALSLNSRSFLTGGLQPEVVAQTLARVQDEWIVQAAAFADCHAMTGALGNCKGSQQSFGKSCAKVVDGIVQGSSGDQNMVGEYMNLVCAQKSLTAVHHDHCRGLQQAINGALQFNSYSNRMHFNSGELCNKFWSTFADSEQKRAKAERLQQKEMLIRANELAKKKRVEAAEKKRKEEIQEKALEEQRKAVEAKDRAAKARKEAVERLARRKAEAQAAKLEAQQKVAKAAFEAAKAAEEHHQRELEHEKAEAHLRNITMAHQKASMANASAHSVATPTPVVAKQAHQIVKAEVVLTPKVLVAQGTTKGSDHKEDVKAAKKESEKKDEEKPKNGR